MLEKRSGVLARRRQAASGLKGFRGNLEGRQRPIRVIAADARATAACGYRILSARAALTAALACSAPKTTIEAIVALASSGVTSCAMLARPSTLM